MSSKVVVVTGANKGLGYEIVKKLAKEGQFKPILAGRQPALVTEAQQKLKAEGLEVETIHIDLNNLETAKQAAAQLKEKYGKIYALVNNAAVLNGPGDDFGSQADGAIEVNYFGTSAVTHAFLPILEEGGRIVFMSSRLGDFAHLSAELLAEFKKPELTEDELTGLARRFVSSAKAGTYKADGWPVTQETIDGYRVTKIVTTTFARILAREHPNLVVVSVCPGWCKTDMGSDNAPGTAESGADTAVWTLSADGLESGKFYGERQVIIPEGCGPNEMKLD